VNGNGEDGVGLKQRYMRNKLSEIK